MPIHVRSYETTWKNGPPAKALCIPLNVWVIRNVSFPFPLVNFSPSVLSSHCSEKSDPNATWMCEQWFLQYRAWNSLYLTNNIQCDFWQVLFHVNRCLPISQRSYALQQFVSALIERREKALQVAIVRNELIVASLIIVCHSWFSDCIIIATSLTSYWRSARRSFS